MRLGRVAEGCVHEPRALAPEIECSFDRRSAFVVVEGNRVDALDVLLLAVVVAERRRRPAATDVLFLDLRSAPEQVEIEIHSFPPGGIHESAPTRDSHLFPPGITWSAARASATPTRRSTSSCTFGRS